jgi:hypothetical protein
VELKVEKTPLSSHLPQAKKSPFLVLEGSLTTSTVRTLYGYATHARFEYDGVLDILRGFVMNAFQPKSMVEKGCGHESESSL